MAEQIRTVSSAANVQNWTPSGATGAVLITAVDNNYVESHATNNTATGTLPIESLFTLPNDAVVNSVVVRSRVKLASAGMRTVRAGFAGDRLGDTQNLTSTEWITMDFPISDDIMADPVVPWTKDGVNALQYLYFRAYADADGPIVHLDYLAIVVNYTSNAAPDPDPISIPNVTGIYSGSSYITKVLLGENIIWPLPAASIDMTVAGTDFAPQIELSAGSTATITWDAPGATITGTDTQPIFNWPDSGPHTVTLGVSKRSHLTTINLGFDSTDDVGYYGPGPAYDYPPQPVVAITGTRYLSGLKRFLAANGPLSGEVDLTGCSTLEFIECFGASIDSLVLDGCSSLIRLCVEANNIPIIDLNPIRGSIRDLRAADMQSGTVEFTTLTGDLTYLYHFCVRSQTLVNMPTLDRMPVLEQWWVWNCNIVDPGVPASPIMNSIIANGNNMDQSVVDRILTHVDSNVTAPSTGIVRLTNNAVPSAVGQAAASNILARGNWTVEVDTV